MITCKINFRRATVAVLVCTAVLMNGCRRGTPTEDPDGSAPVTPVQVRCAVALDTSMRPSIELIGTLQKVPEKTVMLSTQFPGQVQSISVVEGQSVRRGDELLRLDDRIAKSRCDKVRATVEENRAIVQRLRHGSRPEDIDAARQELSKAESSLDLMQARLASGTELIGSHAIAKLELQHRQSAAKAAEAEVAAARARLKLLEIGPRPEEIAEAEARLAGAEADLATSELEYRLTRVTAPIDGIVTDLPIRQGMFVSEGTTMLTLADLSTVFVQTRVPTVYLSQVCEGQRVDIRVTALPDREFSGSIARVGKQADIQTGDVDAFATVYNPEGQLRPGLACRMRIWLPEIPHALVVPVAAIADRDGTPVVTLVREGRAHEVTVRVGARTMDLVQIMSGLSAGDLVAVEGGYGLPDGCPCKVELEQRPTSDPSDSE